MPTKEDLLYALTVKQLKQLAYDNRVDLVGEDWFGEPYRLSMKEDIVEALMHACKEEREKG